jgi:RNA polymerase sigma-70 factor (ECF subfamily)
MTAIEFSAQLVNYEYALKPFAYSLTKDTAEGEDLFQDTIYRALLYRDKFQSGTNFKAWLMTIMKNIFINNYRKNAKRPTILDGSENQFLIDSMRNKVRNEGENEILKQELNSIIKTISQDIAAPFLMYFNGYKYNEIAEHLDLPIGTVKSRIFLARKEMQSKLKSIGIGNSTY